METSIIIIIIGLFIFWVHYLSGFFERRNIPDLLGLSIATNPDTLVVITGDDCSPSVMKRSGE